MADFESQQRRLFRQAPKSGQSRVDFEVNDRSCTLIYCRMADRLGRFQALDYDSEPIEDRLIRLHRKDRRDDDDGRFNPCVSESNSFLHGRHGNPVGAILKCIPGDRHKSMSIGIRFGDERNLGMRITEGFAHQTEVVFEGGKIDLNPRARIGIHEAIVAHQEYIGEKRVLFSIWIAHNRNMSKREEILQASYEIVGKEGLEGLHARSVAAVVGVNHAAVHYYFKTRHDLLVGLLEYTRERYRQDRTKFLGSGTDPEVVVEAELNLAEAYCKPSSRLLKVWASLFVAAQADEVLREHLMEFWAEWSDGIKESLRAAKKAGMIQESSMFRDPGFLVAIMIGLGLSGQLLGAGFDASSRIDLVVSSLLSE